MRAKEISSLGCGFVVAIQEKMSNQKIFYVDRFFSTNIISNGKKKIAVRENEETRMCYQLYASLGIINIYLYNSSLVRRQERKNREREKVR